MKKYARESNLVWKLNEKCSCGERAVAIKNTKLVCADCWRYSKIVRGYLKNGKYE